MPLSDVAIKNAKPAEKPRKLTDEKGLYPFRSNSRVTRYADGTLQKHARRRVGEILNI